MACGHNPIPDERVYKEIPFLDGPEMIWLNIGSNKEGILNAEETEKIKPELICFDGDGWTAVKLKWLESCRYLGRDCTADVETVETSLRQLNEAAEKVRSGLGL